MRDLGAARMLEPFYDQVRVAAKAHRRKVEFVRILLGVLDKFRECIDGNRLVENDDLLTEERVGNRLKILQRLVG